MKLIFVRVAFKLVPFVCLLLPEQIFSKLFFVVLSGYEMELQVSLGSDVYMSLILFAVFFPFQ